MTAQNATAAIPTRTFVAILWRDIFVTGRELPSFLAQVVLQPLFLLFVFGRLLSDLGFTRPGYDSLLVPGVISLTVILTGLQGTALPLVIEFGYTREIEDRLLAPLPILGVGLEKVVFGALRALAAGALMIPIAHLVVHDLSLSTTNIPALVVLMVLGALLGAAMGMVLGTFVPPQRISVMFALVLTPLLFTGCVQYPWPSLGRLPWFKIVTLLNPMTYLSEGLRASLVPVVPHMSVGVAIGMLGASMILFTIIGLRGFLRRSME